MKKIMALAVLTLRSALNSRIVIILGVLLTLVLAFFPLHIQGDGTGPGRTRILLEYTLGTIVTILSFSIAWTACSAVAQEAAERHLQLVLTKPVTRLQIWMGKWVGLIALHAAFLFAGALILYLILLGSLPHPTATASGTQWEWAHYQSLKPAPESLGAALNLRLAQARQNGQIPPEGSIPQRTLNYFTLEIRRALATIAPTTQFTWSFELPPEAGTLSHPLRLQYRFAASRWERTPLPLEWLIQRDPTSTPLRLNQTASADQIWELPLPSTLPIGPGPLLVSCINLATNPPTTVVFEPDQSIHLRVTHRDNGLNFCRGILVLMARLSFFAAVGLTAGCLFSTPTALFFTAFILVLLSLGSSVHEVAETGIFATSHTGGVVGAGSLEIPILAIHRAIDRILSPVQSLDVISQLSGQERVSWAEVGRAWRTYVLYWGGVFFLVGLLALRRREFGKPKNL